VPHGFSWLTVASQYVVRRVREGGGTYYVVCGARYVVMVTRWPMARSLRPAIAPCPASGPLPVGERLKPSLHSSICTPAETEPRLHFWHGPLVSAGVSGLVRGVGIEPVKRCRRVPGQGRFAPASRGPCRAFNPRLGCCKTTPPPPWRRDGVGVLEPARGLWLVAWEVPRLAGVGVLPTRLPTSQLLQPIHHLPRTTHTHISLIPAPTPYLLHPIQQPPSGLRPSPPVGEARRASDSL